MSSIDEMESQVVDEGRQPLDVTKEFFTEENLKTKSNLNGREIMVIARALWFGTQYNIPEIGQLVKEILLLRRSKGGQALKYFKDTLKNMKPSFETKEGDGAMRI